jgi:hypothetical protein
MTNHNDAVYPRVELISREAKRKYNFQSAKVIENFSKINDAFLDELFSETVIYFYLDLYQYYLERWIELYEWYRKHASLNYTYIDEHWFANNYKPLEQPDYPYSLIPFNIFS